MMKTLRHLLANGMILSILLGVQWPFLAALAGMQLVGVLVSCLAGAVVAGGCYRFLSRRELPSGISSLVHCMAWGNLGMLVGWWMDAGFQPVVRDMACFCECLKFRGWELLTINWMQLLMLFGCLLPCIPDLYKKRYGWLEILVSLALMDIGMLLGGWLAGCLEVKAPVFSFYVSFFAMSMGMLVGTSIAHWIFRNLHQSLTANHYEQSYR